MEEGKGSQKTKPTKQRAHDMLVCFAFFFLDFFYKGLEFISTQSRVHFFPLYNRPVVGARYSAYSLYGSMGLFY